MVKVSTTSVAIQTDLTWSNGEEKYKKMAYIKTTNKQIAKAASEQVSKASQVSLDSRNPPKGLSGEPSPSKPTTGKDTKQLSKDAYSGRLKRLKSRSSLRKTDMKLWLKWMILWIYHKIVHKHKNRQRKNYPHTSP